MTEALEASLRNVVEQKSLKWIFVGGKGGVGKTTCSCSLAVQLAKTRGRVLLISTDPAHNTSDAFSQKFSKTPQKVNGIDNLFVMEIDASVTGEAPSIPGLEALGGDQAGGFMGMGKQMLSEIVGGLPGADEAMSFAEMIKLINSLEFDVVVFDTAPTGHTLRLLQFPSLIENAFTKLLSLQSSLGPMVSQLSGVLGLGNVSVDEARGKIEETLHLVTTMNKQFKDPELTTFVCVCIAEFLSLYETERLIQELTKQNIDTHNIIVNQLLFTDDSAAPPDCKKCASRAKIQAKYLGEIADLYEDFHVTRLPLLDNEVRGPAAIQSFSEKLVNPNQQ